MSTHWLSSFVSVAHITKSSSPTGASVFIFKCGLTAASIVIGSAPATREIAAMYSGNAVQEMHGILISGGSAFGLDACGGLMRYQREQGVGVRMGNAIVVPVCPTACIYDLSNGTPDYVTPEEVYEACATADEIDETIRGNIGAGAGATVSKLFSPTYAYANGGMAFQTLEHPSGFKVTCFTVCNAVGDVYGEHFNQLTGPTLNGVMHSTRELLRTGTTNGRQMFNRENTTLSVIFTNAVMDRQELLRLCKVAATAYGRAIIPVCTANDGDIIFAFTTNQIPFTSQLDSIVVGDLAAECLEKALRKTVEGNTINK